MVDLTRDIDIGIGSKRSVAGASRIRRALDSIKNKSRQVHRSGERDAKRHSKSLGFLRTAALAVTGVLAAKSLLRSQIDFGQAISDLSAITGAVGKDLEFLSQKSKEFGETTTLSASQAAEAFRIIASAKPDLLESVDALALVTQEAIVLAEATGDTLPVAANVMAASLNQFSAGADQASRFINVLAAGSKRGAAVVGEMGEALKFAGVIASKVAKLGFEETNAALQLLSTFAIKGGEAGSQLRGILLALSTQSNDLFNPAIVGLQDALKNLSEANLSATEATKLFQRRNLASATVLIENRDKLAILTKQITGTSVAYEQQATRVDNLSGDLKGLKSAYEGVELTIGKKLNGTLRLLTQAATENLRALAKNPLLQKRTSQILDTIHRGIEDIGLAFDQLSMIVTEAGGGAEVLEAVYTSAIQNIIKWAKFLWEQFVIGGPANLKLAFTLMIGAADIFRITLVEKIRLIVFSMIGLFDAFRLNFVATIKIATVTVIKTFVEMGQSISRVFDNMRLTIAGVIDSLILSVAEKITSVASTLDRLGFDERAAQIRNIATSIEGLATNEEKVRKQVEANEAARRAEIAIIDDQIQMIKDKRDLELQASREVANDLIQDTRDVSAVQRQAALDAIDLAIMERDATLEQIKALRTKRKEIEDGAASVAAAGGGAISNPLAEVPNVASEAYENLNDVQQEVVDSMAQGISDMASQGKLDFTGLALSIIQDLIRIQLQTLLTDIFSNFLSGLGGGGGTGGGGTGGGTSAPASLTGVLSGEHGVTAKVGGSGGTDSQRILINATPGEVIQIRTPQQQRDVERREAFENFFATALGISAPTTQGFGQERGRLPSIKDADIATATPTTQGFAQGGSFKIGGSGGSDSQVAIIKASPDEVISIRTIQQQKTDIKERGREKVKVQFIVNNFTDAKVEATQSQDVDGNVLIQASITAVSRDITRNGSVFQAMQARRTLQRR